VFPEYLVAYTVIGRGDENCESEVVIIKLSVYGGRVGGMKGMSVGEIANTYH
jgi:hypothetical protein